MICMLGIVTLFEHIHAIKELQLAVLLEKDHRTLSLLG